MDNDQTVGSARGIRGEINTAKLVEATALALLALILGMITIWAQVIVKL